MHFTQDYAIRFTPHVTENVGVGGDLSHFRVPPAGFSRTFRPDEKSAEHRTHFHTSARRRRVSAPRNPQSDGPSVACATSPHQRWGDLFASPPQGKSRAALAPLPLKGGDAAAAAEGGLSRQANSLPALDDLIHHRLTAAVPLPTFRGRKPARSASPPQGESHAQHKPPAGEKPRSAHSTQKNRERPPSAASRAFYCTVSCGSADSSGSISPSGGRSVMPT